MSTYGELKNKLLSGEIELSTHVLADFVIRALNDDINQKIEHIQSLIDELSQTNPQTNPQTNELESFIKFATEQKTNFIKNFNQIFEENLAITPNVAIKSFNEHRECFNEWKQISPDDENTKSHQRVFQRIIYETIDIIKSFIHDQITPNFQQITNKFSDQIRKQISTDERTYVHVTGVGQFLESTNQRKLFMIWCIANMIEQRRRDANGVHHNFVTLEELVQEVTTRLNCTRGTALKKINLITINDDPKLFVPFFRTSPSGELLFFVSQEKWLKFLLDKHGVETSMRFHRQIRPASELESYQEFTTAMVRAVAENPVPRPRKMTKGFFNKKERPHEVIPGRGIDIIAKMSGFSEGHCMNLLSRHDRQMKRLGQTTIQRRYTTLKMVHSQQEAEEALEQFSDLGHIWFEPAAFRRFGKQPLKLKLSNAYRFTGAAFAKRMLKIKPRKKQKGFDETMNDTVALPTTSHFPKSPAPEGSDFELRSTSSFNRHTMIVEETTPKFHHVDGLYSNNPTLIIRRLKKLRTEMSDHCRFLLKRFGVDITPVEVDLNKQRSYQIKKMIDESTQADFIDPQKTDAIARRRLRKRKKCHPSKEQQMSSERTTQKKDPENKKQEELEDPFEWVERMRREHPDESIHDLIRESILESWKNSKTDSKSDSKTDSMSDSMSGSEKNHEHSQVSQRFNHSHCSLSVT